MSSTQKTDLQQAVDQVNPAELADNLKKDNHNEVSPTLSEEQKTPFIDESLRTDTDK